MVGQAISQAGSAVGGVAKGAGITLGGMFKLLFFVKARWTISILLIAFFLWQAGVESIKQKNISPIVFNVGGRIVSSDETLYWELKRIEANGWRLTATDLEKHEKDSLIYSFKSILAKGSLIFNLLTTFWFLYVIFFIFYWILNKITDISAIINFFFALLFIIFLQSLYGSAMLYLNYECDVNNLDLCISQEDRYKQSLFALTPAKGIGFFAVNIINGNLLDAFKESAVPFLEGIDKQIKGSINDTVNEFDILNNVTVV